MHEHSGCVAAVGDMTRKQKLLIVTMIVTMVMVKTTVMTMMIVMVVNFFGVRMKIRISGPG